MASPPPPPPPPEEKESGRQIGGVATAGRLVGDAAGPLELIIGSIEMLPDALAAAAVCRSWRAAAAGVLDRAMTPRRLLWLLTVPSGGGESSDVELYDIFNGVSRRSTLPGVVVDGGWKILGSSPGWLLVMHGRDRRLSLVSPFTAAHIPLPHCPPRLDPVKAVVSAGPSSGSYRVLLFSHLELYSIVSGDKGWQLERTYTWGISDCICYCGRFLAVDLRGCVMVLGANSPPQMTIRAPSTADYFRCFLLAPAPWGELLLVRYAFHFQNTKVTKQFEVFVVNLTEKTLERTENLHGHTLIIDSRQCSLVSAECHRALPSDTIIFFDKVFLLLSHIEMDFPFKRDCSQTHSQAGVYNLRSRSFLPMPPSLQPPGHSFMLPMMVISTAMEA